MPLVKSVSVAMKTEGYDDAKLKIERLKVASEELARQKPEIKPQIDKTKTLLEARLLRDGIKRELAGSLDVSSSKLSIFERLGTLLKGADGNGGLLGAASNAQIPFIP